MPGRRAAIRKRILGRTLALVVLVSAALLGAGAFSYVSLLDYDRTAGSIREKAGTGHALDRLLELVSAEQAAQRGYAISGQRQLLGPEATRRNEIRASLSSLRVRIPAPAYARLTRAVEERLRFGDRNIELVASGQRDAALARVSSGAGDRLMEQLRNAIRDLDRENNIEVARLVEHGAQALRNVLVASATMALLMLVLGVLVLRSVRRGLRELDTVAHAAEEGERRFRSVAERASDLIRVFDPHFKVLYTNPACLPLLGYSPEELDALRREELLPEPARAALDRAQALLRARERPGPIVHQVRAKDGRLLWMETQLDAMFDEHGAIDSFQVVSRDVTARVEADQVREQANEALRDLSARDELTGLLNRRGFLGEGGRLLERAANTRSMAVLCFCDLDGLKSINDLLGHETGDQALRAAATLLKETARGHDVVARLGGDELVMLGITNIANGGEAFIARLLKRIHAFNEAETREYRISLSVGTALYRPEQPESLDALLARADAAMYVQKRLRAEGRTASGQPVAARAEDRKLGA